MFHVRRVSAVAVAVAVAVLVWGGGYYTAVYAASPNLTPTLPLTNPT